MLKKYWLHHHVTLAKKRYATGTRKARMQEMLKRMQLREGMRVVDFGGAPEFWKDCSVPLDLTIVNLPGINQPDPDQGIHQMTLVDGDACDMHFDDMSFDLSFSNSVIEHVGDDDKQAAMAKEVRRLAPAYWVQTPSIWFPIEAHNNMPFWWFYPEAVKKAQIERWRKKLPAWTEMVETTTLVSLNSLREMFPDGQVFREWSYGFLKSYSLFKPPTYSDSSETMK